MKTFNYALMAGLCLGLCCGGCVPKAKVTVRIVDDNNQPISDAIVAVNGFNDKRQGGTDKDGCFTAKLRGVTGQLDLNVKKQGFYTIWWYSYFFKTHTNNQWIPWNPTIELQLHKIGKPVPMVVKNVEDYLPVLDSPVGYDLSVGDWVAPYGKGAINDFIFKADRQLVNDWTYSGTLSLNFSAPADGLILHRLWYRDDYELRLGAQAPLGGYSNQWAFVVRSSPNPTNGLRYDYRSFSEDDNYYFRVRSQTNASGEIISARYGKIYRGIHYAVGDTNINYVAGRTNPMPWVRFDYYLNPDGTRNTEFDTRSNLCPNPGTIGGKP